VPDFRHRLTRPQQRIYDRSNQASGIVLKPTARLHRAVQMLPDVLKAADVSGVQAVSQAIADEICGGLGVARVIVEVNGTRPADTRGELHGLYTYTPGTRATIKVWMITAKRGQVVAFKTFLRTLLHEICHHLDYALLKLGNSFHTDGFYRRESSLFHQVGATRVSTGGRDTATRNRA